METQNNINKKPKAEIICKDGNIFNILGICKAALSKAGLADKANEMQKRVLQCDSYDKALSIIQEYVDIV